MEESRARERRGDPAERRLQVARGAATQVAAEGRRYRPIDRSRPLGASQGWLEPIPSGNPAPTGSYECCELRT